jgi:hypothetical protein
MARTTTAPGRPPNQAHEHPEVALLLDLLEAVVDPEPCRIVEGSCFSHHFFDIDPRRAVPHGRSQDRPGHTAQNNPHRDERRSHRMIYIDDMRRQARVGKYTARWSHLTADTQAELHAFAARLGLRQSWFQNPGGGRWHYDVTDSKRDQAIAMGAQQIAYRDMPTITLRPGREGVPTAELSTGADVRGWPA